MNYEILIRRRGEHIYAAYCPQLDLLVTGAAHEEVEEKMRKLIEQHKTQEHHAPPANGVRDKD